MSQTNAPLQSQQDLLQSLKDENMRKDLRIQELERQLQELKVKTQNLSGIYIESLEGDHPAQRNWEKNHDDTVGSLRKKLTF